MSIILVTAIVIAILLILGFFAMNKWSSPARDQEKSAELRRNRQMTPTGTEGRGTGIN